MLDDDELQVVATNCNPTSSSTQKADKRVDGLHVSSTPSSSKTEEGEIEECIRSSSSRERVKQKPIWTTPSHLLKTFTPEALICSLKDGFPRSGGYDINLGIKAAEFYFGMFYRTLYYSLFAKIDDIKVIVGFEVINFLSSFVLCFLRMSTIYFRRSTKYINKLASWGVPVSICRRGEEKWKAELSVRWI